MASGGMDVEQSTWAALDGYHNSTSSVTTLVLGSVVNKGANPQVWRTPAWQVTVTVPQAGAPTYSYGRLPAAGDSSVETTLAPPLSTSGTGPQWWLTRPTAGVPGGPPNTSAPEYRLGGPQDDTSQVIIDPAVRSRIYLAGRNGVYRSTDSGMTWYPAVRQLSGTIDRQVLVHPSLPGKVASADTDWSVLTSTDRFTTGTAGDAVMTVPGNPKSSFALTFGPGPGFDLYHGIGDRDPPGDGSGNGEVVRNEDPYQTSATATDDAWVTLGQPDANGQPVIGLAVGDLGVNRHRVIAVVEGEIQSSRSGLYTRDVAADGPPGGVWTPRSFPPIGGMITQLGAGTTTRKVSIAWKRNCVGESCRVVLYDPTVGLFTSGTSGKTWTRLESAPADAVVGTGYVALDPRPGSNIAYVTTPGGMAYRFDTEEASFVKTPLTKTGSTNCSGLLSPGPVTVDSIGRVYLTTSVLGCTGLWEATGPGATTLQEVSDGLPAYKSQALFPHSLAVSPNTQDGHVFVSTNGNSVMVVEGSS